MDGRCYIRAMPSTETPMRVIDPPERIRPTLLERVLFPAIHLDDTALSRAVRGKSILVTGATFGIGEALALRLGAVGARLFLVARTEEKLRETARKIQESGGSADWFACDLYRPEFVDSLLSHLSDRGEDFDVFVNNAGKSIRRSIWESLEREHDFSRTMEINYHAPVRLCLRLIPGLAGRGGQILNISAANVLLPPAPLWAAYQASKTAFDQWLRCASPELRAKGMTTTSVYLPLVRTRMIEPTREYAKLPAMDPNQVAAAICRCIVRRSRTFKPWWLPWVEPLAYLTRGLLAYGHERDCRRARK